MESDAYARARPRYPAALYTWIASHCASHRRAWDCATGNGQAAIGLARYFDAIEATDISPEQIAHAQSEKNVVYSIRSAEDSGFAEGSFDLVTVAQALHWFNFPKFWAEVSRVTRDGAFFCAWGYDWLTSTTVVDRELVAPFRRILEPFLRSAVPSFAIDEQWTLDQLIDYMETWSAFKRSRADATATAALAEAVQRTRAKVAANAVLPIRMPLKILAGQVRPGSRP